VRRLQHAGRASRRLEIVLGLLVWLEAEPLSSLFAQRERPTREVIS
jgi:hypothetical protein